MLYPSFASPRSGLTLLLSASILAYPAMASGQDQSARTDESVQTDTDDDYHGEIIVSAAGLRRLDVLAGTSVLAGEELQRNLDGQIGEVLADLPGVSATSFSPGASRPVLRGFQGERVKVLVDGIGAIDVSNTSADHAVSVDPLTAERIEVLRGPAVLLYGSQAIGGAVNIIDKRIPRRLLDEAVHLDVIGALDTAFDRREAGASIDVPLGDFVFHADGSYRETDDFEVPGYVLSDFLRTDLLADADEEEEEGEFEEAEELREAANQRGVVENSATETYSLGAGLSWFGDGASFGFSVGYYDTVYGVPTAPGAGHHHGEEGEEGEEGGEEEEEAPVSIDLEQFRADMRGSVNLGGFFSEARLRAGFSDYRHIEFEGDEVGTTFDVTGFEGRLELVQQERDGWGGSIGAQYYTRDFGAVGAEAYVAPNVTDQYALFALQEFDLGGIGLEAALRYERTDVESQPLGLDRNFDTLSGAIGVSNDPDAPVRYGINLTHAERAPSAEELFSNGPHIATQQFEIGDPDLSTESAWGVEAYLAGRVGGVQANLAVYSQWFDQFIYLSATGEEEDELPVFVYLQDDARITGVEGEVRFPLAQGGPFELEGEIGGDYISARLDNGQAIPRIPPLSVFGALDASYGAFGARVAVRHTSKPDALARFETPTDAFTMVDASLSWRPLRGPNNLTVMLQADNLFDVEGRRHASFTKDFVPLPGRNVKLSVRLSL